MSGALWIAITVCKDYAHILIGILISLWCGSGPCRVVLIKALFNLRCFLKLMAQIWELPSHCWLSRCWKCQQTLYSCGLLRGELVKRWNWPWWDWVVYRTEFVVQTSPPDALGGLLWKPLMVTNGVIRDGRRGRKRTRRDIPSHAFLYILSLEAGYISAWQRSVLTAQNSTFFVLKE